MIDDDSGDPHVLATASKIGEVTLVIPGRNCAATLDRCLQSVVPLMQSGELKEIIFVDDGSTDTTPEIAARYPVRVITGGGQGPGAARNLGWRAAQSELIWFIDSDCVAHPDALQQLLPHLSEPEVAGVGGSYSNLFPESLLATLIHEEIVARHRRMPREVDFLGGFNVLYLRTTLIALGGYDELATNGPGLAGAEDCDLSFRVSHSGSKLRFEKNSRVGHHHPRRIFPYLRTQARHGRFRVQLYLRHTAEIRGDSYTSMWDNLQPPMAMLSLAAIPFSVLLPWGIYLFLGLILLLMFLQCPMAFELAKYSLRAGLTYIPFGFARAYSRGLGMTLGVLSTLLDWQDQVAPRQTNTRRLNGSGNKANQSH